MRGFAWACEFKEICWITKNSASQTNIRTIPLCPPQPNMVWGLVFCTTWPPLSHLVPFFISTGPLFSGILLYPNGIISHTYMFFLVIGIPGCSDSDWIALFSCKVPKQHPPLPNLFPMEKGKRRCSTPEAPSIIPTTLFNVVMRSSEMPPLKKLVQQVLPQLQMQ